MPHGVGESLRHKFTGEQRRVSSEMNKCDAELSWGAVQPGARKVLPAPLYERQRRGSVHLGENRSSGLRHRQTSI